MDLAFSLAIALGLGLLIGLQRGFEYRALPEGGRMAGWRTFGLIGLGGGVAAFLGREFGPFVPAAGGLSLALLLALGYRQMAANNRDASLTTAVAAMLTFGLGAMAVLGEREIAVGAAVIVTLLLSLKEQLHGVLRRIEARELQAAVKLLVLSLVVLPLLPNKGFGPYEALNPYAIWLVVVLLAGLSFIGYAAVKVAGPERGLIATGALGGVAASTAVTIGFARIAREDAALTAPLAAGILAACAVMSLRLGAIVLALAPALLPALSPALLVGASVGALGAWRLHRRAHGDGEAAARAAARFLNPFDLKPALLFGALLGLVAVLARAAQSEIGEEGLFALAGFAGLADVDALAVTASAMAREARVTAAAAADAIVIAVIVNTVMKTTMAALLGGAALRRATMPWFAAQIVGFAALGVFL
jgi:uncharacterized membrane protein (DUF4010 family)